MMSNSENPIIQRINELILESISVQDLIRRFDRAKKDRISWDTKWNQIQDQVFPDYRDFTNSHTNASTPNPKTGNIKNHSGVIFGKLNKIVSILSSQVSDPSVDWLKLEIDDAFAGHDAVKKWLSDCKKALYKTFADPCSNFYPSTFALHGDWFILGTACREIILRKDNGKILFNTVPMTNVCVETSGYGDIDVSFRSFLVSPTQAYDIWGENLHPSQLKLLESAKKGNLNSNKKFEYIEVAMPNPILGADLPIALMEYVTLVIDKTNKIVVDISHHHQSPYIISRCIVAPGETYGRSLVWYAMPDILAINRNSKRILQAIDYAVFPVNLVRDETSISPLQMTPGAFVQGLDFNGSATIQQMPPLSNPQTAIDFYNMKTNELDDVLVARDLFPSEAPNMTATEVNERKIQANNRIRPLIVRLEHEDLNRMVLRVLSLLMQQGKIPFPYDELEIPMEALPNPLEQLNISFSGQMAKMQRMQEIVNLDAVFQKAVQAAQIDPSVLDRINLDAFIVADADIYGVNPYVMNDDQTVQQIREQRAQSEQAQQQSQNEAMLIENMLKLREAGISPEQLVSQGT